MENGRSYTFQELAAHYKVDSRTLYNWLAPIREELLDMNPVRKKRMRVLIPKQVRRIREFLN